MGILNGSIPKKVPTLAEIKEQRKELRARIGLAREKQLLESLLLWDDFGGNDLLDRIRPRTNDGQELWIAPPAVPSDRRHGADWWVWRTQPELDRLRQESRLRVAGNAFAQGLLRNLTNNTIGKGCTYKAVAIGDDGKPVPENDLTGEQKIEAHAVQRIIDKFLKLNNWNGTIGPRGNSVVAGTREREAFRRQKTDGEAFIRFHRQDDGTVLTRFLDASRIRDGGGYRVQDGWTYGIQHQMEPFEDVETYLRYVVFWPDPAAKGGEGDNADDTGTWEEIDAAEVLHIKGPDTPSEVKRGLPLFIFDVGQAVDRAAKLQKNASIGAAVRAAIAETWQYEQATQAQISSMAQALAERQIVNPVNGQTTNVERVFPGMVRRGPAGATLVPPSADNTESYRSGVQGDLQQASASTCSPAFWLGDTENANYSNLESASAPAVRAGQCEQEYWKAVFARCAWKAVEWAAECGQLQPGIEDRICIQVDAPAVLHRNELEKAQEDSISVQGGWKDRQTCAAERGLDWDQVQANNEEYQQQVMAMAPPLPMLGEEGGGEHADFPKPPKAAIPPAKTEVSGRGKPVKESKDAQDHQHKSKRAKMIEDNDDVE